jgi:hypothetical protein
MLLLIGVVVVWFFVTLIARLVLLVKIIETL